MQEDTVHCRHNCTGVNYDCLRTGKTEFESQQGQGSFSSPQCPDRFWRPIQPPNHCVRRARYPRG